MNKFKKFAFCLSIAASFFIACQKEVLEENPIVVNSGLINTYSEVYNYNHDLIGFIDPDRLKFSKSIFVNSNLFGDGYLIPLNIEIPQIIDTELLKMYAFFIPDENEILEITVSAPDNQQDLNLEVIKYLSGSSISKEMSISIISEKNGVIAAQTKDNYLYKIVNDPDHNENIFKKASVMNVFCAPEDTWYIVRYYYYVSTGQIYHSEIIGTFCAAGKEIEVLGGGGGTTPTPGSDTIGLAKAFVKKSCLTMTTSQKSVFEKTVNEYYGPPGSNCLNKYIYKYNLDKNLAITLCVDASTQGNARYNPQTSTLNYSTDYSLKSSSVFAEEFYHAFQNFIYPGGTAQYLGKADGNIEFEFQLQKAIDYGGAEEFFHDQEVHREYKAWLTEVTHDFTFKPTTMRELFATGHPSYFYFVEKYAQQRLVPFSSTLQPLSLFHTSLNVPNTCN